MKKWISVLGFVMLCVATQAQQLYVKTFGNPTAKPIIFLHGGPGYNAVVFEATTAQRLADAGYFIIVYDRRGEGRSTLPNPQYTFTQTFSDLDSLYNAYHLTRVTLMGHSFGGIVATEYAKKYPQKINTLVLVSAPVALQATFKNIIARSAAIYEAKKDTANLKYIAMFKDMDTTSLMYGSYAFMHAMQNGFYTPKNPTDEAKAIYATFRKDSLAKYGSQMTQMAPMGFWKNEHYTTMDLTADLQALKKDGMKIYALYGKDDGLYSPEQVAHTAAIIGKENLKYFDDCSHNIFADQQTLFINAVKEWVK